MKFKKDFCRIQDSFIAASYFERLGTGYITISLLLEFNCRLPRRVLASSEIMRVLSNGNALRFASDVCCQRTVYKVTSKKFTLLQYLRGFNARLVVLFLCETAQ